MSYTISLIQVLYVNKKVGEEKIRKSRDYFIILFYLKFIGQVLSYGDIRIETKCLIMILFLNSGHITADKVESITLT